MNTPTTLEHEEPVFPEEAGGPPRPLDFYGLTIPPWAGSCAASWPPISTTWGWRRPGTCLAP